MTWERESNPVRWWLVLFVLPLAGCALPWGGGDDGGSTVVLPGDDATRPDAPMLTFGGDVTDARDGRPIVGAVAKLDLAQVRPCRREGIVWAATDATSGEDGRFGPMEVAVPRSDDVAFFLRVSAEGYSEETTFIGPQEARGDTRNLTIVLHPDVSVNGTAAPGTVVALEWPGFPRLAVADEDGNFSFPHARVEPAQLVTDASPPWRANLTAPATVDARNGNGTAWRVEGVARLESGAPTAADVVAWNGTWLVGAARAGDNGVFVLPLDAEPREVRIEARTADGRFGGSKVLLLNGPPAQRESVLLRALC